MPTRGIIALAVTTMALVLLINFKTPDQLAGPGGASVAIVEPAPTAGVPRNGSSNGPAATPGATKRPGATPTPVPASAGAGATTDVTGPMVPTRYGPVQVEVQVSNGSVIEVIAVQLPSGGRSGRISQIAGPLLRQEALSAQNANIDGVSGATYTSRAYEQSLQAALDQAGA
jgi:uncharacterized protein with FMN-binding domain